MLVFTEIICFVQRTSRFLFPSLFLFEISAPDFLLFYGAKIRHISHPAIENRLILL